MGTPNLRSTPSTKVRWTPSQAQLRVLERLYEEQAGIAPSKEQIKEITTQLSQLGDITDRSVYYWFQNRKARARQKQPLVTRASSRVARPKTRHENRAGRNKVNHPTPPHQIVIFDEFIYFVNTVRVTKQTYGIRLTELFITLPALLFSMKKSWKTPIDSCHLID